MRVGAILLAAGQGRRLGGATPKALVALRGKPLFMHSIRSFNQAGPVYEIVLTVPRGTERRFLRALGRMPARVVPGGRRRQDSVARGLRALPAECDLIIVHDTARPLIQPTTIRKVVSRAARYGACIVAAPATDTIKRVRSDRIVETLDREILRRAQTPQAFHASILRKAYDRARRRGWKATDCASLVERIGRPVRIIEPTGPNLKVTTKEDLAVAERLLKKR
jgi:2-C-methyl-D-erythritol 4-phosphate cytidylyltransferase